jgi:hypothetical protein
MQMQCHAWGRFFGCFWASWGQVGGVSLNRFEQALYDYVKGHPEERHYWHDKVRALAADSAGIPSAVARIDSELWRYFVERSAVLPEFCGSERGPGLRRTSMKNLAEFMIGLWTEPKPRKPAHLEP